MAKISQEPTAGPLTGDEVVPGVQGGETVRMTTSAIAQLAEGFSGLVGTATGQIPVWNNDTGQWVAVTPASITAADIPASSTGYVNSDGTTVQGVLDDFDHAISTGGGGSGGGGTGGGTGPVVADTFTRPDASVPGTADTGQAWTVVHGGWGIQSNRLYRTTSTVGDLVVIDAGKTDQIVTVTMVVLPSASKSFNGVVGRYQDSTHFYTAQKCDFNQIRLLKTVGGTVSVIGAATSIGGSWLAGDTIGLSCVGSTIKALRNGTAFITVTDTSLTTGTKVGIQSDAADSNGRYDGFQVT